MGRYDSLDDFINSTYIGDQHDETIFDFYQGVFTSEKTKDGDVTYTDVTNNPMYANIIKNPKLPILRAYEVIDLGSDEEI